MELSRWPSWRETGIEAASLRPGYHLAVTGYRPQSDDTSIAADQAQFEVWRSMPPARKMEVWAAMQIAAVQVAEAGIRRRHPEADDREVFLRRVALTLDPDTMVKAYGWDPSAHG